uniref:C2H2-type domain-containing protein n=1 Tax=Biomphalaria glabrata TaxID=6526 RepID=A0A2C9L764_BIOGL
MDSDVLRLEEYMDVLYRCKFCPFTCSQSSEMSSHVRANHLSILISTHNNSPTSRNCDLKEECGGGTWWLSGKAVAGGAKRGRKRKSEQQHKIKTESYIDTEDIEWLPSVADNSRTTHPDGSLRRRIKPPRALKEDYVLGKCARKRLRESCMNLGYKIVCPMMSCKAKFKTDLGLHIHLSCHNMDNAAFTCMKCQAPHEFWKHLRIHLWKEHKVDCDLFQCDQCDYKTDTHHKMSIHKEIHTNVKPYTCDICNKGFRQASQMKNHQVIHTNREEKCSARGWFSSKSCDICDRVFANSNNSTPDLTELINLVKPPDGNNRNHAQADPGSHFSPGDASQYHTSLGTCLPVSMVKTMKNVLKKAQECVDKRGNVETQGGINTLDELAALTCDVSSLVDDFVSAIYVPLNYATFVSNGTVLSDSTRSILKFLRDSNLTTNEDEKWLDILSRACDHNLDKLKSNSLPATDQNASRKVKRRWLLSQLNDLTVEKEFKDDPHKCDDLFYLSGAEKNSEPVTGDRVEHNVQQAVSGDRTEHNVQQKMNMKKRLETRTESSALRAMLECRDKMTILTNDTSDQFQHICFSFKVEPLLMKHPQFHAVLPGNEPTPLTSLTGELTSSSGETQSEVFTMQVTMLAEGDTQISADDMNRLSESAGLMASGITPFQLIYATLSTISEQGEAARVGEGRSALLTAELVGGIHTAILSSMQDGVTVHSITYHLPRAPATEEPINVGVNGLLQKIKVEKKDGSEEEDSQREFEGGSALSQNL